MIISLPVGILQLLLLNAANTGTSVSAYTTHTQSSPSFRTRGLVQSNSNDVASASASASASTTSTRLYASDPVDPYASLLDAYKKKDKLPPAPTFSLTEPAPVVIDVPSVPVPVEVPTVTADADGVLTLSDKVDGLVEAINNAASSAMEASNQATNAAASIKAPATATVLGIKATAAAKTAAVAGASATATSTSGSADKAPSFVEYLSNIGSTKPNFSVPAQVSGGSSDAKEKLILLKQNLFHTVGGASSGTIDTSGATKSITEAAKSMTAIKVGAAGAGAAGAGAGIALPDLSHLPILGIPDFPNIDLATFVENLQFDEYGGWYATAVTFAFAINQKEAGKLQAANMYEEELNLARMAANEAAESAVVAAEGAQMAKDLVAKMPKNKVKVGDLLLESSRVRSLQVESVSECDCDCLHMYMYMAHACMCVHVYLRCIDLI